MPTTIDSQEIGKIGEALAVKYLKDKGFRIIDRNFVLAGIGEVDIIAYSKGVFHFIEVKASATYYVNDELHALRHFDDRKKDRVARVMRKYCDERDISSPRTISFLALSFSRETLLAHVSFEPYVMLDTV